jgi:hypothetical protein
VRLTQPWSPGFSITRNGKYGMRTHPITGKLTKHRGIDVAGVFPVTVAADGVVVHVGADWHSLSPIQKKRQSGGNNVIVDHGQVHTVYYHGAQKSKLQVGQRVTVGDFVFTSGTTGSSTNNHLHFEVRRSRAWGTDVDPIPYLNGNAAVAVLTVSGRADRASWRAWQTWLQERRFYTGRIDGVPGRMTYTAIQRWLGLKVTGELDSRTRRAVQERLGVTVDGVWGKETWCALQGRLNDGSLK